MPLILDKLVFSLLIAAVVVFVNWRIANDNRAHQDQIAKSNQRHQDEQSEIDRDFKRAEYVKELVPVVNNLNENIVTRAHALSALIETNSLGPNSALSFAHELLRHDLLGAGSMEFIAEPPNESVQTMILSTTGEDDFFLDALLHVMPQGLPALLREYLSNIHETEGPQSWGAQVQHQPGELRVLSDTSAFWSRMLNVTVRSHSDSELEAHLALLLDEKYLQLAQKLCVDLEIDEAKYWVTRSNPSLKTIGALRLIREARAFGFKLEPSIHQIICTYIESPTESNAALAQSLGVTRLLATNVASSTPIAYAALRVLNKGYPIDPSGLDESVSMKSRRFFYALDYLKSTGANPSSLIFKELESQIVDDIVRIRDRMAMMSDDELHESNFSDIEQALVLVLATNYNQHSQVQSIKSLQLVPEARIYFPMRMALVQLARSISIR